MSSADRPQQRRATSCRTTDYYELCRAARCMDEWRVDLPIASIPQHPEKQGTVAVSLCRAVRSSPSEPSDEAPWATPESHPPAERSGQDSVKYKIRAGWVGRRNAPGC